MWQNSRVLPFLTPTRHPDSKRNMRFGVAFSSSSGGDGSWLGETCEVCHGRCASWVSAKVAIEL